MPLLQLSKQMETGSEDGPVAILKASGQERKLREALVCLTGEWIDLTRQMIFSKLHPGRVQPEDDVFKCKCPGGVFSRWPGVQRS